MATEMASYGGGGKGMDARLWGGLQDHIDLAMVYVKLPIGDFFRLRQVCKEWNRLASDRGFLEQSFPHPISQPHFVVDSRKVGHRLLTYDSSRRWDWSRLPFSLLKCEVAGLLYDSDSNCVFNVHTRVFHKLPYLPEPPSILLEEDEGVPGPLIGMAVDTSVSPYNFQVVLGHEDIGTRIYDSRSGSWTHKPSKMSLAVASRVEDSKRKSTCAQCNGFLYFRVWDEVYMDLHIYNVEKDKWSLVPSSGPDHPDFAFLMRDIGVWQDRVFYFGMMAYSSGPICAYEIVAGVDWMLFDQMDLPDLCLWMLAGEHYYMNEYERIEKIEMQCKFYGESVLVYSCVGLQDVLERFALYNLDRKRWEKVELAGSVS